MPFNPQRVFALFQMIVVLATMSLAATAHAQGTMGTVPDPISTRDLEGFADRLGLSMQQRQAVEALHEQYKVEFSQLRDGDIQKFLDQTRNMGGGGGGMGGMGLLMNRPAVEAMVKDLESINAKIRMLDNRLFDQMQSVLTEEQMMRLPSARQARERTRYRSGLSRVTAFMNPAAQVDLTEIVSELALSPQELEAINPVLSQYESTLTMQSKRLYETTLSLLMDGLKQMEQRGLTEEAMRDGRRRNDMFEAMRTIFTDLQKKLSERTSELSDLNRRTVRSVSGLLSPEQLRRLRDQFYQRGYPEISNGARNNTAARALDVAVKFDDLTDEQRQNIEVIANEYYASLDRLADQAMDAIDDNRKNQNFFDFNGGSRQKFQEKLNELRESRTKINENTLNNMKAALGGPESELVARIEKRVKEGPSKVEATAEGAMIVATPGGGAVSVMRFDSAASVNTEGMSDPFVPVAISKRDLESYARQLNATADEKAVLSALHDDYREKYKQLEADSGAIKAVREAERTLWAVDQGGQVQPQTPTQIENLYSLRRKALEAVMLLDLEFFEDMQIAVGEEDVALIERLSMSRKRHVLANVSTAGGGIMGGPTGRGGRGGQRQGFRIAGAGGEANVDLAEIAASLEVTPSDATQYQAAMMEYETAALVAFERLYDANMKLGVARDKMMAQSMRGGDGNRTFQVMGDGMRTLMENEGRIAREARTAVAALNKATLPRLMESLPSHEAQQLRRSYYQKAYPGVFADQRSAEPHLQAAMNLPTLNSDQRNAVQEITLEFRSQYDQLCEKLIEMEANAPDFEQMMARGGRDPGAGWQNIQDQMRTREKIEFERNDLNDKAIARLRAALSEEQVRQLGGLNISE